jgi:hypothetical protein
MHAGRLRQVPAFPTFLVHIRVAQNNMATTSTERDGGEHLKEMDVGESQATALGNRRGVSLSLLLITIFTRILCESKLYTATTLHRGTKHHEEDSRPWLIGRWSNAMSF